MNPEIAKIWNDSLVRLKKAEEYLTAGESELAKTKAQHAVITGTFAITFLLREDDIKTCLIALDDFFEWEKDCSRPEDYIAKARKLLGNYSNLSPPENKLPFE
ncbi:MAG: hypothetical protein FVQ80_09740 [Planctomycetes bacterium]|nr:hypothetical protein [Planctomycetota bacterium]